MSARLHAPAGAVPGDGPRSGARRLGQAPRGALLAAVLLVAACSQRATETLFEGPTMGTWYRVKVVTGGALSAAQRDTLDQRIRAELDRVDRSMSTYRDDSLVSRFNRADPGETIVLDPSTAEVLALALEVAAQTGGAFDVTVGPLVRAWGFGPEPGEEPPDAERLGMLAERIGWRRLELAGAELSKTAAGVEIDLSAIAKGFAVDSVLAAVRGVELGETAFHGALVEVGGEIRAAGVNRDGRPWRIAIESPSVGSRGIQRIVELSDLAIATSGDYRNFYEIGGRRYSHIIDPGTGAPVTHRTASVSLIHPRCAVADAYATALLVMGAERGLEWARERNLAALFLVYNEEGRDERDVAELATAEMARLLAVDIDADGTLSDRPAAGSAPPRATS